MKACRQCFSLPFFCLWEHRYSKWFSAVWDCGEWGVSVLYQNIWGLRLVGASHTHQEVLKHPCWPLERRLKKALADVLWLDIWSILDKARGSKDESIGSPRLQSSFTSIHMSAGRLTCGWCYHVPVQKIIKVIFFFREAKSLPNRWYPERSPGTWVLTMGLSVEQHLLLNRDGHEWFPPFGGGPATTLPYTSPHWRQPRRTPSRWHNVSQKLTL